MKKEEIWWIVWGIALAFGFQVLYDAIGEYPNITPKVIGGLVIEFVSLVALFLYGRMARKTVKG